MDDLELDPQFEHRLGDQLSSALGSIAHGSVPAGRPRYRMEPRRTGMSPLRLTLAAAGGVMALAGGAVFASTTGATLVGNNDNHGDAVASAAHTCPHGAAKDRDAHGDCVSAVARMNHGHASPARSSEPGASTHSNNDQHGDTVSNVAKNGPTATPSDRDAHGDAVSSAARSHKP